MHMGQQRTADADVSTTRPLNQVARRAKQFGGSQLACKPILPESPRLRAHTDAARANERDHGAQTGY
eukprot:1991620-Lingulodinium_polyedra.AAC.1